MSDRYVRYSCTRPLALPRKCGVHEAKGSVKQDNGSTSQADRI